MRIAIANSHLACVGGIEAYLDSLIPALAGAGHAVAFWHEFAAYPGRGIISLPPGAPCWSLAATGLDASLAAMREWRPDILVVNSVSSPELEERLSGCASAMRFAHDYTATCISGNKMFSWPRVRVCDRRFGWRCLLHFYPHRCGGLNPLRMSERYLAQSRRLAAYRRYKAIITASEHMRAEYLKHGFQQVFAVRLPVQGGLEAQRPQASRPQGGDARFHLIFAGRMAPVKGGDFLIDALPMVRESLHRDVEVTFAGDGPLRAAWQAHAQRIATPDGAITIKFSGWLEPVELRLLMAQAHLLVVPSLWPEPFGLLGLEAGLNWLPAVAFAVGGIPEWLTEGFNGCLARAAPPTPPALADAIVRCLRDPDAFERMRAGARATAERYTMEAHLASLLHIFDPVQASDQVAK